MSNIQPLLWKQTLGTGPTETHTMLIGYAEATLIGLGGTGSVGQEVKVNLGADAPQNISIYADTLYLQPGATYMWPGKNVTIVARRLAMTAPAPQSATISVNGAPGALALPPTAPARPKPNAPPTPGTSWSGYGENGTPATPLTDGNGAKGSDGNPGGDAGSLTLVSYELAEDIRLALEANGGDGSPGLDGQGGQSGQDGGCGSSGKTGGNGHIGYSTEPGGRGGDGVNGGAGGTAGNGSNGGHGGTVAVITSAPAFASKTLPAALKISANGGRLGANGNPGAPGSKGSGGLAGSGGEPQPPKGADGLPGAPGAPATARPADGAPGTINTPAPLTAADFGKHLSPDQIVMVLNRMRFGYLTNATLGSLTGTGAPAAFGAELSTNIAWLQSVVPIDAGGPAGANGWNTVSTMLASLAHKVANNIDYYGNAFDMVPSLNPDVSRLADRINALGETEEWYRILAANVQDYEANKVKVQQQFSQLNQRISADQQDEDNERQILKGPALQDIEKAAALVRSTYNTLNTAFSKELTQIEAQMNFSLGGLLGSLGSICMFAGPESGAMFALGGALSVASQFDPSSIEVNGQSMKKSYLISKVKAVEASAEALSAAWKASNGGFLQPNGDNTMLLGKQEEFDQFLDQYMPENKDLRTSMDTYMAAVQQQNQAVVRYNEHVTKLLDAAADNIEAANAQALMASNLEQLNSPGLMQLARLAGHAYAVQMEDTVAQLYFAGRAYQCLAMRPSAALSDLARLDGLSGLDAMSMKTALTALSSELEIYRTGIATNQPSSIPSLTVMTTASACLEQLRQARQLTIYLSPPLTKLFQVSDPLETKSDLRVVSAKVYLAGVPPGLSVEVDLMSEGRCQVRPSDAKPPVWFNMPRVQRTNVFDVTASGQFEDRSTPDQALLDVMMMTWGGGDLQRVKVPLACIYTGWTIRVPGTVPLDKVTAIILTFSISYRAFTGAATGREHPPNYGPLMPEVSA